jgi:hypothetical protein
LELRRRHPKAIKLNTFGKGAEGKNGADWEWHIIGARRKLKMRVQEKRLQMNDTLKIRHKVASSGKQQIDLLIADSKANRLKPIYCIYASEAQRSIWRKANFPHGFLGFEAGCLLADAYTVKSKMPKRLPDIENHCVPWHYLIDRKSFAEAQAIPSKGMEFADSYPDRGIAEKAKLQFPTLDDLNSDRSMDREIEGLAEFGTYDYERIESEGEYRERGITKLVQIDLREIPL